MRKFIIAAALAAPLLLGGCASSFERIAEERAELGVIVRGDLEEASRSAHAYNDVVAYTCYDTLLDFLDRNGEEGFFTDASKGAISSFQKLRNARRLMEGSVGVEIRLACSALKAETEERVGAVIGFVRGIL